MSTALGPLRAVASGPVSGRCVLAVRPENVALAAPAKGEGNRVDGRVSLVSYLGNTLRYDVQTALRARAQGRHSRSVAPRAAAGRPAGDAHFPPSVTLAVSDDG